MKYKDYIDLKGGLKKLPVSWYPALILEMVKTAYEKKVFKPNQASVFIHRACEDASQQKDLVDGLLRRD